MKPIDLNIEGNNGLSVEVNNINEKVRQYKEMIQELEKSLMNITGIPKNILRYEIVLLYLQY